MKRSELSVFNSDFPGNRRFRKTRFMNSLLHINFSAHKSQTFCISWDKNLRALTPWWKKKRIKCCLKKLSSGFQQTCDNSLWDFYLFFIHLKQSFWTSRVISESPHVTVMFTAWQDGPFIQWCWWSCPKTSLKVLSQDIFTWLHVQWFNLGVICWLQFPVKQQLLSELC